MAGFGPSASKHHELKLAKLPGEAEDRTVLLYTPMALDLAQFLRPLASSLPDWDIDMVGPGVKIDPADLPQAPNLSHPGAHPGAAECRHVRADRARPVLATQYWDPIADRMSSLLAGHRPAAVRESA